MAFLDDLTREVNKIGRDVTQKTQSFTDGVKLNSQIGDQRKNLSNLYENLGRMAVQDEDIRSKEKYKNLLDMIQNGEQNLKNLEEQLSMSKGEVRCRNCGSFIAQGHVFCQNCGTKIEPPVPPQNMNGQNMGNPNMNGQNMNQPNMGNPNMNGQNMNQSDTNNS